MKKDESLNWAITEEQRDRTVNYLSDAYAGGRMDTLEFNTRIDKALGASTRGELNSSLEGLARVPLHTQAISGVASYRAVAPSTEASRVGGALTHWSGMFSLMLGPGIVYAVTPANSVTHREAGKAFNFQVSSLLALMVLAVIGGISGVNWPMALWTVMWFLGTLIGGIKAGQAQNWTNPLARVMPLRILDDGHQQDKNKALGR